MTNAALLNVLYTARMQAEIAKALYQSEGELERLASLQGAWLEVLQTVNVRAAALVFVDHIHLTVCGSNDRLDWAQNANTKGRQYAGLTAHAGFIEAANWLKKELMQSKVMRVISGDALPIVMGGHSAGGAIAQLLSVEPILYPREVVTFGAPRVFSESAAATYRAYPWETWRFVMDGDPVPHLPFKGLGWFFGRPEYSHTCDAMRIADDGRVKSDDVGFMRAGMRALKFVGTFAKAASLRLVGAMPTVAKSHAMSRYLEAIKAGVSRVS